MRPSIELSSSPPWRRDCRARIPPLVPQKSLYLDGHLWHELCEDKDLKAVLSHEVGWMKVRVPRYEWRFEHASDPKTKEEHGDSHLKEDL